MEKRKVILVGTAYPFRGGIAAFNERLAWCFQKQGYEVEIWTFTVQYPDFLFPGKTQLSTEPEPQGLAIKRVFNSVNPFNWIKVGRRLRKADADLVVMRFWIPYMAPSHGVVARMARKNKKTKVVAVLDNVIPHEKRFGDTLLTKFFLKSIDAGVTMARAVMQDAHRLAPQLKTSYCPHPLYDHFGEKVSREEALAFLNLDPKDHYILFFGIIRDYKGLDLLLQAMTDPRLRDKNVKAIVAGEFYNNDEKYHALEKQLGLEGRVVWHSRFIPDSEVKYYFNAADIVVQPYKSATQSGVTQIAYHFDKPMLVTDVGGLKEMVPDRVGYVTPTDPEAIANALAEFYQDDRLMTAFEQGVHEEKKQFSWDRMVETIVALLNR